MALLNLSGNDLRVLILGLALLVGFASDYLFFRFRIPDVLWLVALGLLIWPILNIIPGSDLLGVAPILGIAALVLILFDAGLDMRADVLRDLARSAILFALASYALATALIFVVSYLFLAPHNLTLSVIFATALGATSGAVVIPVANRLTLSRAQRSLIHLSAAFEDVLAIVAVTVLLLFLAAPVNYVSPRLILDIILPLPVGVLVGVAGGILWLEFLSFYQRLSYAALATLGFIFVIYAVTQALGGSGILAALVLGIVLANGTAIRRYFRNPRPFQLSPELRKVEGEIAFLLRSFFLFLIGVVVSLAALNGGLVVVLAALSLILLGARYGVASRMTTVSKGSRTWNATWASTYGRGLTSAVLLTVPLSVLPSVSRLFLPGLILIVATNAVMTAILLSLGRSEPRAVPAPPPGGIKEYRHPVWEPSNAEGETRDLLGSPSSNYEREAPYEGIWDALFRLETDSPSGEGRRSPTEKRDGDGGSPPGPPGVPAPRPPLPRRSDQEKRE